MTSTSDRARPDARRLMAGLILAMGAALYASLIPFRFVSVPLREVYWQLRGLVFDFATMAWNFGLDASSSSMRLSSTS